MILRKCYSESPKPLDWGEKHIVPVNVTTETQLDADGKEQVIYYADVIENVEELTVTGIVKAAVNDKFTQEERDYVMLNVGNTSDPLVKKYTDFVASITASAKELGYKD